MEGGDWTGKAVSIKCDEKLGIFQGIIKDISESHITIVRAFRNGVPLRKQDAEVTLRSSDILDITLIPSYNGQSTLIPSVNNKPTPVKTPNFANAGNGAAARAAAAASNAVQQSRNDTPRKSTSVLSKKISNLKISTNGVRSTPNSRASSAQQQIYSVPDTNNKLSPTSSCSANVAQFFGNMIPPKVEVRMGAALGPCPSSISTSAGTSCNAECYGNGGSSKSKPIDIVNPRNNYFAGASNFASNPNTNEMNMKSRNGGNGGNGGNNKGSKKQQRKQMLQQQTFGTSIDDPLLQQDFDFEGNLALFDKRAIWDGIEAKQKPDPLSQSSAKKKKKQYRHDENILAGEPLQLRQIESAFKSSKDFVTDEGLVIPSIPGNTRAQIEAIAEAGGLSIQRQTDILARGVTDLAIMLLGGARRLTPNNCHQWPVIIIICDKSMNFRAINIGAATGRQLATHGLKVMLYSEDDADVENKSIEISLFKATGNPIVYSFDALPKPDLVILSTNSINISGNVKKWLSENRASVLAVDPPPGGIKDVSIKYAILPILPLNGISNNCGKLYLCNLGIPDKFFSDAGIKYKSPYGHKFVIPIHSKD